MEIFRKVVTPVLTLLCLCCFLSMSWAAQLQQQGLQEAPKAEIIPHGGKKIQMQTPALQLQPQSQQMMQIPKPDARCSITASYDQGNAQAIQSIGPSSGMWHAAQDPYPPEVWTHVKIDFSGIKTNQTKDQSFKVIVVVDYFAPSYGTWSPQHKVFNYVLILSPGESYVYDFNANPLAFRNIGSMNFPWYPLKATTKIIPDVAAIESDPGNNGCEYTINFTQ